MPRADDFMRLPTREQWWRITNHDLLPTESCQYWADHPEEARMCGIDPGTGLPIGYLVSRPKEGTMPMYLADLKSLNLMSLTTQVEELAYSVGQLRQLAGTMQDAGIAIPKWLQNKLTQGKLLLEQARTTALLQEQMELETKRQGMLTKEEQRKEIDGRLAEIEALLNPVTPAPAPASVK